MTDSAILLSESRRTKDSYLGDISDPLTLNRYNYVKSSPLNYADPSGHRMPSLGNLSASIKRKTIEITGKAIDYVNDKVTCAIEDLMNLAQDACRDLDCGLATVVYNVMLGAGFALVDNLLFQTQTFVWQLSSSWDAYDSQRYRQEMEDWIIENGATDTTYFYLGQVISDVLQTYYAVKIYPGF